MITAAMPRRTGAICSSGTGTCDTCATSMRAALELVNGGLPLNSSYATQPSA